MLVLTAAAGISAGDGDTPGESIAAAGQPRPAGSLPVPQWLKEVRAQREAQAAARERYFQALQRARQATLDAQTERLNEQSQRLTDYLDQQRRSHLDATFPPTPPVPQPPRPALSPVESLNWNWATRPVPLSQTEGSELASPRPPNKSPEPAQSNALHGLQFAPNSWNNGWYYRGW